MSIQFNTVPFDPAPTASFMLLFITQRNADDLIPYKIRMAFCRWVDTWALDYQPPLQFHNQPTADGYSIITRFYLTNVGTFLYTITNHFYGPNFKLTTDLSNIWSIWTLMDTTTTGVSNTLQVFRLWTFNVDPVSGRANYAISPNYDPPGFWPYYTRWYDNSVNTGDNVGGAPQYYIINTVLPDAASTVHIRSDIHPPVQWGAWYWFKNSRGMYLSMSLANGVLMCQPTQTDNERFYFVGLMDPTTNQRFKPVQRFLLRSKNGRYIGMSSNGVYSISTTHTWAEEWSILPSATLGKFRFFHLKYSMFMRITDTYNFVFPVSTSTAEAPTDAWEMTPEIGNYPNAIATMP